MKAVRTAESKKYNLYSVIHKYARHEINRVTELAGSIDFFDRKDRAAFFIEFKNLFDFLDDHSKREDLFIHPLLKKIESIQLEILENDHRSLDVDASILKEDLKKYQTEEEWYTFYLKFVQFQVAYFSHLNDEETKIMPELQARFNNDSLHAVSRELMKDMPHDKMIAITKIMLRTINHHERVPMYMGMKASMPIELFKDMCKLAQSSLSQDDASKLFIAIGIKHDFMAKDLASSNSQATSCKRYLPEDSDEQEKKHLHDRSSPCLFNAQGKSSRINEEPVTTKKEHYDRNSPSNS